MGSGSILGRMGFTHQKHGETATTYCLMLRVLLLDVQQDCNVLLHLSPILFWMRPT